MKEFLAMIKILTTKLENLHEENLNLHCEAENHSYELVRLQDEQLELRNQLRMANQAKDDLYWFKDQYHAMLAEQSRLRTEDPILVAKAEAWMQEQGIKLFQHGDKIGCIKGIRFATNWGLKESKDYCEGYKYPLQSVGEIIKSKLG
jgi:hypothetical protein